MSISMVDNVLDTMIVDPIDTVSGKRQSIRRQGPLTQSYPILKAAPHYFPLDASPISQGRGQQKSAGTRAPSLSHISSLSIESAMEDNVISER
jgi:hypothetical protein